MDTIAPTWLWIFFVAAVLAALVVDFVVLEKQGAHEVGVKEALHWSIVWVLLSFAFNALFWWAVAQDYGTALANEKSMAFLTGYLIEKSLAVDNIFVFLLIFGYFAVPPAFQKRVLMIGIVGAIVLRTVMILLGSLADRRVPLGAVPVRRLPAGHRHQDVVGRRPGARSGKQPGAEAAAPRVAGQQGFRRREVLHPRERQAHRHAAAAGDRAGRPDRRDLRGRFHSGDLRHHHRPVHRAHQQRLRHPRPARDVLPAGRGGRPSSTC